MISVPSFVTEVTAVPRPRLKPGAWYAGSAATQAGQRHRQYCWLVAAGFHYICDRFTHGEESPRGDVEPYVSPGQRTGLVNVT